MCLRTPAEVTDELMSMSEVENADADVCEQNMR